MDTLQKILYYGIWVNAKKAREDGGEDCYREMTPNFKFYSHLIMILVELLILYFNKGILYCLRIKRINKFRIFEKIIAQICLIIIGTLLIYKLYYNTLIFILNPCHISIVLTGVLFYQEKKSEILFEILFSINFGQLLGLVFPAITGITQVEIVMFYAEHLLPLLSVVYLQIVYFKNPKYNNFKRHVIIFTIFSLYQRALLYPFSEWTWVNLNFVICAHPKDPFFIIFGKYYLILSEVYLCIGSYLVKLMTYPFVKILKIFNNQLIQKLIQNQQIVMQSQNQQEINPILCTQCQNFFANSNSFPYCSKCSKNFSDQQNSKPEQKQEVDIDVGIQQIQKIQLKDLSKCQECFKKLGIRGFTCECGFSFCKKHRLPEEHKCEFDFKFHEKQKLASQNQLISKEKIEKI